MAIGPSCGLRIELMQCASFSESQPTATLHRFFQACEPNPCEIIGKRVKEMAEALLPDEKASVLPFTMLQPSLSAERRTEVGCVGAS